MEPSEIYEAVKKENNQNFQKFIYGKGDAAKQIVEILKDNIQ